MKDKIFECFAVMCLVALLSGCGQESPTAAEEKSADEVTKTASLQASNETDENDAEDEEIEYDTFEPLTDAELEEITEFVRRSDAYGFLYSEYGRPEEVSLGEVFYMGAGLQEEPTDEEVKAYLKANEQDEVYTHCIKMDADKVRDLIRRRLDCDPDSLDLTGVGTYLPEYDAFYREEADVNYVKFTCISGIKNAAGGYDVYFHSDYAHFYGYPDLRTILLKDGDEFVFISNEHTEAPDDLVTESSYDEAYLDEHAEELWDILYKEKFSSYEPIEMRHGLDAVFSVVLEKGVESYDENSAEMPYESIVSLEDYGGDNSFQFHWHKDYYDGDELFGEKTLGWYWVNEKTGEVY